MVLIVLAGSSPQRQRGLYNEKRTWSKIEGHPLAQAPSTIESNGRPPSVEKGAVPILNHIITIGHRQERFEVDIGVMPSQIDTTSYLNA